tara:strand:- start:4434 stop:4739 length:306 start_codon:yes stop_codon:yes gene_type:complete
MTYLYYRTTSTTGGQPKVTEKTRSEWKHLANKENWRIVQLPNGFYQTEVSDPTSEGNDWQDVTRRETLEGAESAIDGSIEHFAKKLEAAAGPKVVKTFKNE